MDHPNTRTIVRYSNTRMKSSDLSHRTSSYVPMDHATLLLALS